MNTYTITAQAFNSIIEKTDFDFLGKRYEGKVRDNYTQNGKRIVISSDRISCFDRVLTTIPYKGRVLNQLALWWFEKTKHIVANHIISSPHPNVVVVKNCDVLPIEVVVRSYLTGSAWRDYQAGKAISGIKLPEGLKADQKLPELLITPSTKAEIGSHDLPISEKEILDRKILDINLWNNIKQVSLDLFKVGQKLADEHGLIFVDTKYEFGLLNGELLLVDEIHTLDSSRFWIKDTYQKLFESGQPQKMLDKEPVRQWLLQQGFKGDGEIPHFSDEYRLSLAKHYLDSYTKITGQVLNLSENQSLDSVLKHYALNAK